MAAAGGSCVAPFSPFLLSCSCYVLAYLFILFFFFVEDDTIEEKLINEEYKIWKKNTPFLYVKNFFSIPELRI